MLMKCGEISDEGNTVTVVKDAADVAKVESPVATVRRTSSRVQEKQRLERERLVRRRVELLDGAEQKQKRGRRVSDDDVINREVADDDQQQKKDDDVSRNSSDAVVVVDDGVSGDGNGVVGVEKGPYMRVKETLRLFNKHYLHFAQEETTRCEKEECSKKKSAKKADGKKGGKTSKASGASDGGKEYVKKKAKRPDLKAITRMLETNAVLYPEKRVGALPGIDVGHQFYSRAEMCAVGFHSHWLNGIDYVGVNGRRRLENNMEMENYKNWELPLAVAIVLSGMYEDDLDKAEEIVYTGQGGHDLSGNKRQNGDQVLLRGNLALKNSADAGTPVRVIRGHDCPSSYTKKLYTYDGLYNVTEYWAEKGISGFTVYKYRLKRCAGQPRLTTGQVSFINGKVPQSLAEIRGLVDKDISGGQENIPIPATNLVDDPAAGPTDYVYSKSNVVAKNVKIPKPTAGCNCKGSCVDPRTCACAKLNGSEFPYVNLNGGRLVEARDVVFECGPNCGCGPGCVNRVTQRGLRHRLEVFRTASKGWGVRSWDYIPSGAPVCEYTGILMRTEDLDNSSENNYIFEIDCLQTMKGIGGRERRARDVSIPTIHNLDVAPDDQRSDNVPEFCVDAGSTGGVARFINHSCEPNLFVQCVLSSHHDVKLAKVMLFAADSIPPLQELSYDYGYALDSVHGPDGKVIQMPCYCGARGCRRRLF